MFYKLEIADHIRVPPDLFGLPLKEAITKRVKKKYEGFIDKDLGVIIDVLDIGDVKEGIIIPGDGAAYYETSFSLISFKPELQEVILGKIKDVADFGAFLKFSDDPEILLLLIWRTSQVPMRILSLGFLDFEFQLNRQV